jgi:hypothetical protein
MSKARQWIAAGRAASPALLALAVAACQIPDFNQMYTPKLDLSTLAPADPTQFARKERSITPVGANDLVDAAGSCPGAAPASPPPEQTSETAAPVAPTVTAPVAPRGVALQMTECEVVQSVGRPAEVQIGADQHGERTVTMIYATPERPIYRFVAGRLKTVERGAEPLPPEPVKKKKPQTAKRQAT